MRYFLSAICSIVLFCAAAAIADPAPLLIDFGPAGTPPADGYTAVTDAQIHAAGAPGWVIEDPNSVRFIYSESFDDPQRVARDALEADIDKLFAAKYPGMVGGTLANTPVSLVYRFTFPAPIRSAVLVDQHHMWWGKGNYLRCSVSADGQEWTQLYERKRKPLDADTREQLDEICRGSRQLFVKYEFNRGSINDGGEPADPRNNTLHAFAVQGVLEGPVDPADTAASLATLIPGSQPVDDTFSGGDDALRGDGVVILQKASFRADLPAGRYFVEAVAAESDFALQAIPPVAGSSGVQPITTTRRLKWRRVGEGEQASSSAGGILDHPGGELTIAFQAGRQPLKLMGLHILPDAGDAPAVAWREGRLVVEPASSDPAVAAGLAIIERAGWAVTGDVARAAIAAFEQVRDPSLRARLIAATGIAPAGWDEDALTGYTRERLNAILQQHPHNVAARQLLDDIDRLAQGEGRYEYERAAWDEISTQSLFYPVVQFRKARVWYHEGEEARGEASVMQKFREYMTLPRIAFANDPLVRMYDGQKLPWGEQYLDTTGDAPRWASLQRELLGRYLHVIHWWLDNRRQPGGDFKAHAGQGLNDTVEMMRQWSAAGLALNDPDVIAGATDIADHVWRGRQFKYGFTRRNWDIQHSSEEQSDTQPWMIALHYGDPQYFERNLAAMTLMRDLWTAVNEHGHRHFRSAWISAVDVQLDNPSRVVDVPYATRAAKSGHWVSWYSRNPDAEQLMTEWSRAWAEDSMRDDRGKPAGLPPSAIRFADEQLGGAGQTWWNPGLGWDYFIWPGPGVQFIYDQMLLGRLLTGDDSYTQPHRATMELLAEHAEKMAFDAPEGGPAWAAARIMDPFLGDASLTRRSHLVRAYNSLEKWRLATGDTQFDAVFSRIGSGYMRYRLTGDTTELERELELQLEGLRYNLPLLTDEVWYLDRVPLDYHKILFSQLTGQPGEPTYAPAYEVTWDNPGRDLAALVREGGNDRLAVQLYSFRAEPHEVGMFVWRLQPGQYQLIQVDDAGQRTSELNIRERGQRVALLLAPQQETRIEIKLLQAAPRPELLPDIAIGAPDLKLKPNRPKAGQEVTLTVTVHNIGAVAAQQVRVRAVASGDSVLAEATLGELPASRDLQPSTADAVLRWTMPAGDSEIQIQISCEGDQITTRNDTLSLPR